MTSPSGRGHDETVKPTIWHGGRPSQASTSSRGSAFLDPVPAAGRQSGGRSMAPDPLIRVTDLRKTFGKHRVLDGLDVDVHEGEALAVLGANGAGKTTLLKILATLLRPTRGTATVAGYDCGKDAERVRRHVGLVAHGSYVYEDLTALEDLTFWTTLAGLRASAGALAGALASVELERFAGVRVRTFSAGMKRRLSLARFVLARPRVLLLDEPFAGLDQRAKKWLEGPPASVKSGGGAIGMAAHSLRRGRAGAGPVAPL